VRIIDAAQFALLLVGGPAALAGDSPVIGEAGEPTPTRECSL